MFFLRDRPSRYVGEEAVTSTGVLRGGWPAKLLEDHEQVESSEVAPG